MFKTLFVLLFLGLSACSVRQNFEIKTATDTETPWNERKAYLMAHLLNSPEWEKRWWIEKTVRLLRGGRPLRADENIADYESLPKEQIIDQLLAKKEFGDTVLDFNMFFLGFRMNILTSGTNGVQILNPQIYNYPTAIASAQNVLKDQDYLQILESENPAFIDSFNPLFPRTPEETEKSQQDLLKSQIFYFRFERDRTIRFLRERAERPDTFCRSINMVNQLTNMGPFSNSLTFQLQFTAGGIIGLQIDCFVKNPDLTREKILDYLAQHRAVSENVIKRFEPLFFNPPATTIADVTPIDLIQEGFTKTKNNFSFEQTQALPNSSTNSNRKRAAYILKHFYCDDLSPVGVDAPTEHVGGEHGSETSCYSCHYKLDPMAGFFKDRGVLMLNFANQKNIIFDDGATKDLEEYQKRWKNEAGGWNIGYIRSINQTSLNSYGENLDDLARITREAPEVKRCLVKRMFEYFISENQVVDGGYLNHLAQKFDAESKVNSSQAMKNVVRQLLLSQSFANTETDSEKCYDFAPGSNPGDGRPCKVAYVLEKNCKTCHSSTGGAGRLDLTHWIKNEDGSMTFPHVDASGKQIATGVTFDQIVKRLSTSDPNLRMPYKKEMISQERQELFLWAQKILSELQ